MSDWVTLAGILRTRGNKGEVVVENLTTGPDRFLELRTLTLRNPQGEAVRELQIEDAWDHQGVTILKFVGVDSINAAEELKGHSLAIPEAARRQLPGDEFFINDLIGCEVVEPARSLRHGKVAAFHEQAGGTGLLELDNGMLIPVAKSICTKISPEQKLIEVTLPEGLSDLNRNS